MKEWSISRLDRYAYYLLVGVVVEIEEEGGI